MASNAPVGQEERGVVQVIHGDDDQIVPIGASANASSKLGKNATPNVYPRGSHGLADTHEDALPAVE
jgi:non-heme chloroperoxidase